MPDIAEKYWTEADDRNTEQQPNGFPGNMPAQIDTVGRMVMGAVKRSWRRSNPYYLTSGIGDAYVVTPDASPTKLNQYEVLRLRIDRSNITTTPTLKFGRAPAATIVKVGPSGTQPLDLGDLIAGGDQEFWFDGADFICSNPATPEPSLVNRVLTFSTRADAVATSIPASAHGIMLNGNVTEGDGDGGLYIDTNNGSADTFVSSDGRTWYRAEDVDRVRVVSAFGNSVPKSPLEYGATGDGTTVDTTAYQAAETAQASVFLPQSSVFNLASSLPVNPVYGGGSFKIAGVQIGAVAPLLDMVKGNVWWTPDSYAEKVLSETSNPGGINYFNTFMGSGSGRPTDISKAVTRSTGFGSAIGERAINWERVEAFGNGAMRFAPYADRVTALGTLAFQWGGGTSQQFLKDTYHDFWLPSSNNGLYPGQEGPSKTVTGVTSANPGVVTSAAHGYANGQTVKLTAIVGMTQLNGGVYIIRNVTTNTFTLEDGWGAAVDTTAFGAYSSGGVAKLQWNFLGMESRAPGLGATLDAFSAYPTSKAEFTQNVAVGRDTGLHSIKGEDQVFIGYQAGTNVFDGDRLVAVGNFALRDGVFLDQTVAVGTFAGMWWQTGVRNLILGHNTAPTVVDGSNNTIVGPYAANGPTSVNNSVLLGYQAGIGLGSTLSEVLAIQRGAARAPLVGGKFDTGLVGINTPSLASLISSFHVWDFAGKERFRTGEGSGVSRFILEDDGSAAGPILILDRKSASPAASDILGTLRYYGRDSIGTETNYADIFGTLINPTDGAETATLTQRSLYAGSFVTNLQLGNGVQIGAPTSGFMGAGTLNVDNAIYRDGIQVVGSRQTGWTTDPTGTLTRTTFVTSTVTLPLLAERVAALIVDLRAHGLINA